MFGGVCVIFWLILLFYCGSSSSFALQFSTLTMDMG